MLEENRTVDSLFKQYRDEKNYELIAQLSRCKKYLIETENQYGIKSFECQEQIYIHE